MLNCNVSFKHALVIVWHTYTYTNTEEEKNGATPISIITIPNV